ncbi:hypothetical protein ACP70R_029472 [Stipagrostis hirtigluma subsp. patula]
MIGAGGMNTYGNDETSLGRLAMLLGEGTSSQPTMTTSSPTSKSAPKKLTPKRGGTAEM